MCQVISFYSRSTGFFIDGKRKWRKNILVNNNLLLDVEAERTTWNLDQVKAYKFRENSETSQMLNGNSNVTDRVTLVVLFHVLKIISIFEIIHVLKRLNLVTCKSIFKLK